MRAIERIMSYFLPLMPDSGSNPSWYSGRIWLQKLGYFRLNESKVYSDDWIWIIDHCTQWGKEKCFVVLGVKASELPTDRALTLEDVQPLIILPEKISTGEKVFKELEKLSAEIGIPKEIIADKGSDIRSGIDKFCELTSETVYLYDIKHLIASLLKAEFKDDSNWRSFIDFAATARKYMQQTTLAGIAPPNQRSKSRYMNLGILINWATQMLEYLMNGNFPEDIDEKQLKAKVGWLIFFQNDLKVWEKILDNSMVIEKLVRDAGYNFGITKLVADALRKTDNCSRSETFNQKIVEAIFHEEMKLNKEERLLSSSEIIESLFGKFKYFEKQQSSSGFTVSVLALAAMVGKVTTQIIEKAMKFTKVQQIKKWFHDNIGTSVQGQRVKWLKQRSEQNLDEMIAMKI